MHPTVRESDFVDRCHGALEFLGSHKNITLTTFYFSDGIQQIECPSIVGDANTIISALSNINDNDVRKYLGSHAKKETSNTEEVWFYPGLPPNDYLIGILFCDECGERYDAGGCDHCGSCGNCYAHCLQYEDCASWAVIVPEWGTVYGPFSSEEMADDWAVLSAYTRFGTEGCTIFNFSDETLPQEVLELGGSVRECVTRPPEVTPAHYFLRSSLPEDSSLWPDIQTLLDRLGTYKMWDNPTL